MLSILYLITLTIAGLAVVQRVMPSAPPMVRLCGGFFLGFVASALITYAVAFGLSPATDNSLLIGILAALAAHSTVIGVWGRGLRPRTVQAVVVRGAVHRRLAGVLVLADGPVQARPAPSRRTATRSPCTTSNSLVVPSSRHRPAKFRRRLRSAGAAR